MKNWEVNLKLSSWKKALEIKFQDVKNAIVSNIYKKFLGLLIFL